jgi:very-short-patch-repair endonuclease
MLRRSQFKDPYLRKLYRKANRQFKKSERKKAKVRDYARENLSKEVYHEMKVFHLLRAFFDLRITRQFVIDGLYIVDLYIPQCNLIIEVDGGYHASMEQMMKDARRENYLRDKGFNILRFENSEVEKDLLKILFVLREHIVQKGINSRFGQACTESKGTDGGDKPPYNLSAPTCMTPTGRI